MESFLPSEIARLVYGYLEEEECVDAAQLFLETSVHLKECAAVVRKGRKFNTKIYNLGLVDLFDFLSESISLIKENGEFLKKSSAISSRLQSLIQSDNGNSDSQKNNKVARKDEPATERDSESVDLDQLRNPSNSSNRLDSQQKLTDSENKEATNFSYANQSSSICEKEAVSPHFINIKEENDVDEYGFEVEEEEAMPTIEPEVQILSPDIQQRQDYPQTVNILSNQAQMMGDKQAQLICQPPQLLCQPYGMVQMVPAYPTAGHPTLFMPQQNIPTSQQSFTLHQPQTIFQTSGGAVSSSSQNFSPMLPKKFSTPLSQQSGSQQAPIVKMFKRVADQPLHGSREKMKTNIYHSSSKLRPIAPKIGECILQQAHSSTNAPKIKSTPKLKRTHLKTLENGIKVHVMENTVNASSRRRSVRRVSTHKPEEQLAAPLFIDVQDVGNEN